MNIGITFLIPNQWGRFLYDLLKPINLSAFHWQIGAGESYIMKDGDIGGELYPNEMSSIEGNKLKARIETNTYYVIFADLKAFPTLQMRTIKTYEDFVKSDCELALIIVDCSYVSIYCKQQTMLETLYNHALYCGYENVQYVTEDNDTRTLLSVWG
ncbi:DUF2691 family protein [Bacillus ndiopicus]|uniref:DUF2691 family protein n=1 Tax=Bacillus ndiopicus TaxID=1347368 RepID=UPI0005AA8A83|nr:DUF2691 family protein [Bacillus ndiopicus]